MCLSKNKFLIFFTFTILLSLTLELKNLREVDPEEEKETVYIKPPAFSRISGFYPNDFKLKLSSEENTTIYYTLDSTDPRNSTTSKRFEDYILIYDREVLNQMYTPL